MARANKKRWEDFVHTVDVLVASALVRDDEPQLSSLRPILFTMPAAAAASDGDVTSQSDEGASWRLLQSRHAGTFVLLIEWKTASEELPTNLTIVSLDGLEYAEHPLPTPDADGIMRCLLDENIDSDKQFMRLLRLPQSNKVFEK